MNRVFAYKYSLRQHLFALIGAALCFYFGYHTVYGERSIVKLISLDEKIETLSQKSDILSHDRTHIERKVVMLRPGSIDQDLLEERVRIVLGYKNPHELVIMRN